MAVSTKWYANAVLQAMGSGSAGNAPNIDYLSDSIKAMLVTSSYTFDQNAHVFKSDITNEISGTGYTATGVALASKTLAETALVITWDAADPAWTSSTFTARGCVIYDATPGSDATRPLLWFVDFGADVTVTAGTFTIVFNASGIATLTVS